VDTYQDYNSNNNRQLVDLDGQTGAQIWQYNSTTARTRGSAVAANGNIYLTDADLYDNPNFSFLLTLNGATGAILSKYTPPSSIVTVNSAACNGNSTYTYPSGTPIFGPVVGPDGTVYAAVKVSTETDTYNSGCGYQTSVAENLYLLAMPPNGSPVLTQFHQQTSGGLSGDTAGATAIIPDGQAGALVSWFIPGGTSANPTPSYHISDVSSGGATDQTYSAFGQPVAEMVLGDSGSGLAYATDFRSVVAFNISGGSPVWTYAPGSNNNTNIIAALTANKPVSGNKLSILNTTGQAPITQTLLLIDNTGAPTSAGVTGNISSPLPDPNLWLGISNNSLSEFVGPTDSLASSAFPLVLGNLQGQSKSPSCQTSTSKCAIVPIADTHTSDPTGKFTERDITYGGFSLQSSNLTHSLHHKIGLLEELLSGGSINCLAGDPHTSCDGTDQLPDALAAQFTTGSTVRQKLFVDRVQVKVYWPYGVITSGGQQTQWFGAYSQQATTSNSFTSGAHITQESPDSSGVLCTSGCSKIATDGTTTLP
jgi:hypothetical protein